jgi:hypothetical protein
MQYAFKENVMNLTSSQASRTTQRKNQQVQGVIENAKSSLMINITYKQRQSLTLSKLTHKA